MRLTSQTRIMRKKKELKPPPRKARSVRKKPRGFLIDADTSLPTLRQNLSRSGFVVEFAADVAPGASDRQLLRRAARQDLIIVTRNRGDFGALVFDAGENMPIGVIEVCDQQPNAVALAHEVLAQRRLAVGRFLVLKYNENRQVYEVRTYCWQKSSSSILKGMSVTMRAA